MNFHDLKRNKAYRWIFSIVCIVASALAESFIMQAFMDPCNLLSGGFTSISLLLNLSWYLYF